jgi:hypothetical protein
MISKIWKKLFKPKTVETSATPYDYIILKHEQEYKVNRSKINWEVYDKLKKLDCDFLWNHAGDKVKPIWLADNPNIKKIERLAYKLQR